MATASLSTQAICPVCGSACTQPPLYRFSVAEAAAHFCPVTRSAERNKRLAKCIQRLWQADHCTVLGCEECGFAFGLPFVGGDEEFYSILHEHRDYPAWRWDYGIGLNLAVSKFPGGRILDIGAGTGAFLRTLGKHWDCYAVEKSSATQQELERLGIKVSPDVFTLSETESNRFEVVTLFQVLEHIAEFRPLLLSCRRLLRQGGHLVVTVPDAAAMIRQKRMTGHDDMPPNHISKWTPASLRMVLTEAGFEVGPTVCEPSSWRNLKAAVHMRVMADASGRRSLAAQVYHIQKKHLRRTALMFLGLPALVRLLPNARQLRRGGAFALIGVAR